MNKSIQNRIQAGIILLLLGLFLGVISFLPASTLEGSLNIPRWLLYLLALLFGTASLLAFQQPEQRWSNLLVAVIFFSLAISGAWIALRGSAAAFSGGISALAPETNLTFNSDSLCCRSSPQFYVGYLCCQALLSEIKFNPGN